MRQYHIKLTDQEIDLLSLLLGGAMEQSTFMPTLTKEQADAADNLLFRICHGPTGSITDTEIDDFGIFSEHEKGIIKRTYSEHEPGFFPNPRCALY
jgi:transcriptional antiterminator